MIPDSALRFAQGMLEKVIHDYRAPELAESMANPQRHLYKLMIGEYDQKALEIAIKQSTPEQVARWFIRYLTDAGFDDEDVEDEDTKLMDAIPTSVHPEGSLGVCFTFGEPLLGEQVGMVYMGKSPRYTRFLVVGDGTTDQLGFQPISERALTLDEITHFEQLARSESS